MQSGTVKRVESERGFGFIADASGNEYFFHRTSVADFDSLRGGESVTFDEEESPKGKRANNVRLAAAEPPAAATEEPAVEAADAEEPAPAGESTVPATGDAGAEAAAATEA